jgi:hypothetical protein
MGSPTGRLVSSSCTRGRQVSAGWLVLLGDIDHVPVYQYRFDLGARDVSNEDERLGDVIASLMN